MSTCPLLFIVHTRWVSTSEHRCIRDVNNPQSKVRRQYQNYDCDCIACQTLRAPQHNQWKELIEEIAVMAMDGVCHCGVLWRHHDLVGTGPKHKQDHADSAWLLRYISLLYFIHPFGSNGLFQVSIYANSNNIIMENLWWWATHTHTITHGWIRSVAFNGTIRWRCDDGTCVCFSWTNIVSAALRWQVIIWHMRAHMCWTLRKQSNRSIVLPGAYERRPHPHIDWVCACTLPACVVRECSPRCSMLVYPCLAYGHNTVAKANPSLKANG